MLDSITPAGSAREAAAARLEHALLLPLDDDERAQVERDEWGESPEAIAEAERIDATLFGGAA